ncbi:pentapeptide repeat-containing protein [Pseudofrankia sp. BMG5.36]|uniref:pentapeptide repeat-containing protein n=1 Tax=Pseudofrankia sp. BMG5.36 TaxID=1834512 RepID=UPI000ABACFB2
MAIWLLPAQMYPDAGDADARAALQSGLLTASAALIAVVGGLIALDETRQANAEIRRANENTHVRELYTRAVDQIGSEIITVRLGGIYALERIAEDSPPDQRTVVEVLSAFIRVRSTALSQRLAARAGTDGESPTPTYPAADIRAAMQVLARLPVREKVPRCDLTGTDLAGPASLAHLTLTDANLADAWLSGADLNGAVLSGTNLTNARLRGADLTGAWLDGANLTNARLSGANLTNTLLNGAILTGTRLSRTNLVRAVGLSQEQVNAAWGDSETQLPEWLTRPESWPAGS